MPRHQSKAQKDTIQRVMHEFKHGELERKGGQTSQARTEGRKAARPHAASKDGKTRAELYAEAKHRNIPGRSKMSKPDLERALHK